MGKVKPHDTRPRAGHAVQLLPLPPRLPAGRAPDPGARRAFRAAVALAGPARALDHFLRLLGLALRAADRGLDPRELERRARFRQAAALLCSSPRDRRQSLQCSASSNMRGSSPGSPMPWAGSTCPNSRFALPLGISFFTFHHVMYLADLRAGIAPLYGLTRYGLYIAFFPQVLSGPLVRWSEVMHQFEERAFGEGWQERFGRGLTPHCLRPRKKDASRRRACELRKPDLQPCRRACPAHGDAGLGRRARLHLADLLRLLGLHRHGARHRAHVRHQPAAELQRPLSGHEPCRLLAALAHDARRASCATIFTFRSAAIAMGLRASFSRFL